jgi:hypothetical protein
MLRTGLTIAACSVLALACTKDNPLFGVTEDPSSTGGDGDADGTGDAESGRLTDPPTTTDAATSDDPAGSGTAGASTGQIATTGEPDPTTGDATSATTSTSTTGDTTTGDGTTGDGLLDPGAHALIADAHCVGVDTNVTVTLSAAECAQVIAQEEATAKTLDFCPALDATKFGALAVDFHDEPSDSFITTHLRFSFPDKLAPGDAAINGVLTLTAGCDAQYVAGKQGNTFKPGEIFLEMCDQVPRNDGDKHPNQLVNFPVSGPKEVGGQMNGVLEPGERVEWPVDGNTLNEILTAGADLCVSVWIPFSVENQIHYQGSAGPSPPTLEFTVE